MFRGDLRILGWLVGLLVVLLVNWRVDAAPSRGGYQMIQGQADDPLMDGMDEQEAVYTGNRERHFGGGNSKGVQGLLQSLYLDSSPFLPYIHPKFIYEEDVPVPLQEILPPGNKRATKGLMVDVVDFVAKGGNSGQRLGQDMRSSGRKRRSLINHLL